MPSGCVRKSENAVLFKSLCIIHLKATIVFFFSGKINYCYRNMFITTIMFVFFAGTIVVTAGEGLFDFKVNSFSYTNNEINSEKSRNLYVIFSRRWGATLSRMNDLFNLPSKYYFGFISLVGYTLYLV